MEWQVGKKICPLVGWSSPPIMLKQRRFAGARTSSQHDQLPGPKFHMKTLQHVQRLTADLKGSFNRLDR